MRNTKRLVARVSACIIVIALAPLSLVRAQTATPVVTSFTAPSATVSGQPAGLVWTIANGGGHTLIAFCASGVQFFTITGSSFPCNTRTSISAQASDSTLLSIVNVSGSTRMVTIRLIPKDASGADYDAGSKDVTIAVQTSPAPISSFLVSATTTTSGAPVTFSWTSPYLSGVNLSIPCQAGVIATSSAYGGGAIMPCGTPIFPTDLPPSSNVSVQFTNVNPTPTPLTVTLLPAATPGIYDGTRAATIPMTIASDVAQPISVSSFTTPRTSLYSGDAALFSWAIANARSANLRIGCNNALTYQMVSAATTTVLACGQNITANDFAPTASTSIIFLNSSPSDAVTTISLFPAMNDGTYDGTRTASLSILVHGTGAAAAPAAGAAGIGGIGNAAGTGTNGAAALPSSSGPAGSASPLSNTSGLSVSPGQAKTVFTRPLSVGSRGVDVRLLQLLLSRDKTIYPEGIASGYFGTLTANAVGRLQEKFNLITGPNDPAYGFVGPKTRALLNSLE